MRLIRTISTLVSAPSALLGAGLLLAGCLKDEPPPVTSAPRTPAVCEALRPAMPIGYHGKSDTPDTIERIRAANARFAAACP